MYIPESFFKGNELTVIFDEIIKTVKSEKIKTKSPKNAAECVEAFAIYQPQQQILKQSANQPVTTNNLTHKLDP
jgi:hypothetical protein